MEQAPKLAGATYKVGDTIKVLSFTMIFPIQRLQDIVLDLRGVATNAKAYHKALQGRKVKLTFCYLFVYLFSLELSSTSGKLFSSIQNIGAKVSSLTGSVSALGWSSCFE